MLVVAASVLPSIVPVISASLAPCAPCAIPPCVSPAIPPCAAPAAPAAPAEPSKALASLLLPPRPPMLVVAASVLPSVVPVISASLALSAVCPLAPLAAGSLAPLAVCVGGLFGSSVLRHEPAAGAPPRLARMTGSIRRPTVSVSGGGLISAGGDGSTARASVFCDCPPSLVAVMVYTVSALVVSAWPVTRQLPLLVSTVSCRPSGNAGAAVHWLGMPPMLRMDTDAGSSADSTTKTA